MSHKAEYRYVCRHIKDGKINTVVNGDWVQDRKDVKIIPHRNQLGEACLPTIAERVVKNGS
jgi:hypothetical protein